MVSPPSTSPTTMTTIRTTMTTRTRSVPRKSVRSARKRKRSAARNMVAVTRTLKTMLIVVVQDRAAPTNRGGNRAQGPVSNSIAARSQRALVQSAGATEQATVKNAHTVRQDNSNRMVELKSRLMVVVKRSLRTAVVILIRLVGMVRASRSLLVTVALKSHPATAVKSLQLRSTARVICLVALAERKRHRRTVAVATTKMSMARGGRSTDLVAGMERRDTVGDTELCVMWGLDSTLCHQ